MFTGLVAEIGTITAVSPGSGSTRLQLGQALLLDSLQEGDSVAVNGVCLTVAVRNEGQVWVDVMGETLRRSTLGEVAPGEPVNLEPSLTLATPLGGHLVQGHVDGIATVIDRVDCPDWRVLRLAVPAGLMAYVVEKGSLAVHGVSLTVSARSGGAGGGEDALSTPWCEVSLIPTTLERTTLGGLAVGARVNIEVDILAKYVESLLGAQLGRSA